MNAVMKHHPYRDHQSINPHELFLPLLCVSCLSDQKIKPENILFKAPNDRSGGGGGSSEACSSGLCDRAVLVDFGLCCKTAPGQTMRCDGVGTDAGPTRGGAVQRYRACYKRKHEESERGTRWMKWWGGPPPRVLRRSA